MSLKSAIRAGVDAAINSVRDLMVDVDWTFVSTEAGDYDVLTDSFSSTSTTKTVSVLAYSDVDDDAQVMFSSRGNFVETPTQIDTIKILMSLTDSGGMIPSVRDTFVWESQNFMVSNMERVPGDSVFIMRSTRI